MTEGSLQPPEIITVLSQEAGQPTFTLFIALVRTWVLLPPTTRRSLWTRWSWPAVTWWPWGTTCMLWPRAMAGNNLSLLSVFCLAYGVGNLMFGVSLSAAPLSEVQEWLSLPGGFQNGNSRSHPALAGGVSRAVGEPAD